MLSKNRFIETSFIYSDDPGPHAGATCLRERAQSPGAAAHFGGEECQLFVLRV